MTTIDWSALLEERNAWVARNFPNSPWHESTFGVMEEVGELAHAHLKAAQHIRGSELEHAEAAMDAIGDATVYLLGIMNAMEHTPQTWEPPLRRLVAQSTDDALLRLGVALGTLCRSTVSGVVPPTCIDKLVYYLDRYCQFKGWDYNKIVLETWARVKRRDWITDPLAGGEHTVPIPEQREGFGGVA